MVSAFVDEINGFGLHMTEDDVKRFKEWRQAKRDQGLEVCAEPHEQLTSFGGVLFLDYGKDRDGYFDAEKLKVQINAVMDFYEWKYTDQCEMRYQILFELDHSSGHAKMNPGSCNPVEMNLNDGQNRQKGSSHVPNPLLVTAEGLGEHSPLLKPGEEQIFTYGAAEGPFTADDEYEFTDPSGEGPTKYEDKVKGMRQIARERGLAEPEKLKTMGRTEVLALLKACPDIRG